MARRKARAKDVLLGLVVAGGVACAAVGWSTILRDERGFGQYSDLAQQVVSEETPAGSSAEEVAAPAIDWDALRDINGDVCGWLSVDGTEISMPVTQGGEEWPDKYLYYSFYGETSQIGCPYLNWQCDPDGRVMTVYGHHVWYSKRMFNELAYTYENAVLDGIGDAWWSTPKTGSKKFQPVGAARIDMHEGAEWNKTGFASAAEVRAWLSEIMGDLDAKSDNAEELARTATRVLVLATCTGDEGWSDTSKRCVTVFADPDPEFADQVSDGEPGETASTVSCSSAEKPQATAAAE